MGQISETEQLKLINLLLVVWKIHNRVNIHKYKDKAKAMRDRCQKQHRQRNRLKASQMAIRDMPGPRQQTKRDKRHVEDNTDKERCRFKTEDRGQVGRVQNNKQRDKSIKSDERNKKRDKKKTTNALEWSSTQVAHSETIVVYCFCRHIAFFWSSFV
jgi:hypothetical protein